VVAPGFKSSAIFSAIKTQFDSLPPAGKTDYINKVRGVFHIVLKNGAGEEQAWTLDLKNADSASVVSLGKVGKGDVTLLMSDDTYVDLVEGKINGQKAFMQGKMKVQGNIALAAKVGT
ncbi:hypothetical protein HK405_013199, partial [Cladochytrium tenue]